MTRRRAAAEAGFTLVELLVVMAILGVVLSLVAAARPRASALRLDAAARAMAAGLRAARADAMLHGTEAVFLIDGAARTYGSPRDPRPLPTDMALDVGLAASERTRSGGAFRFYPDGRSSGGAVTLGTQGHTVSIAVDWLTGEPWVR